MKFGLKSKNVLTPEGLISAVVIIESGKITGIENYSVENEINIVDHGELFIMPSLIDTHVHINEPGRSEWEGFESATKAAAAGGVTMLVDMPLNSSPVTTDVSALNEKMNSAKNKLYADVGFYGGVIPDNINEIEGLIHNGVLGLKAFMVHSGIDDFPDVNEADLRKALKIISKFDIPLLVHAELDCGFEKNNDYNECSFNSFLNSRPKKWENKAIKLLIDLCREFKCHIHIVHLSSSDGIEMIRNAKKEGLKITAETCPHYLFFSSEEIPDKDTRFKCTPPIRDNANREMLWNAVKEGVIDFVVSDHSPCSPDLKCMDEGSFEKAWGGISSLQLGLSVVWTEGKKRRLSIEDVSRLMSTNTASFINMGSKKGKIEKGFDADIIIFDPDKKFIVKENDLYHKHKVTPYSGRELYGVVEATYLRGEKIFQNGEIVSIAKGEIVLANNK